MHNVALVEHGEQALDSAHRVVLARCDIFRQDATCIFESSSGGRRIRSSHFCA
jgi:hypothetical protein